MLKEKRKINVEKLYSVIPTKNLRAVFMESVK